MSNSANESNESNNERCKNRMLLVQGQHTSLFNWWSTVGVHTAHEIDKVPLCLPHGNICSQSNCDALPLHDCTSTSGTWALIYYKDFAASEQTRKKKCYRPPKMRWASALGSKEEQERCRVPMRVNERTADEHGSALQAQPSGNRSPSSQRHTSLKSGASR